MGQALEDLPAKDPSQLSLKTGDLIVILRKFPTGWASGECQGKTGMFPLKSVRILDLAEAALLRAQSTSPSQTTPSSSTSASKKPSANKEKRMSRMRAATVSSVTKVRTFLFV
jgi:hypothetical protein